jgi:hypothetical protein
VEVDSPAANSAEVGCGDVQPFIRQGFDRNPAILSAYGWFGATLGGDGEDIGAAE